MSMLLVAACGGATGTPAAGNAPLPHGTSSAAATASHAPYQIGAVFDITGPASFYGKSHRRGTLLAVKQINANGGVNGHPLNVTFLDGQSDPTKSLLAIKRLISVNRVIALLGPSISGSILAAAPTIDRDQVPDLNPGASFQVVEPVKPWVFSVSTFDPIAVEALMKWLVAHKLTHIAFMTESSGYGASGAKLIPQLAKKDGVNVVITESFDPTAVDLTPQLTNILRTHFDALVVWGSSMACAIAVKDARQLGVNVPIFQSPGVATPKFLSVAGSAANGVYFIMTPILVANTLPQGALRNKVLGFEKAYRQAYGVPADEFAANMYDATYLLAHALKSLPTTAESLSAERKGVRNTLQGTKHFLGVNGYLSFGPNRHYAAGPEDVVMGQAQDGTFVLAH